MTREVTIQVLTEVTLPGPAADGRPLPTISLGDARRRVSAKADTRYEVPGEDDFNRLIVTVFQSYPVILENSVAGFPTRLDSLGRLSDLKL